MVSVRIPWLVSAVFRGVVWRIPTSNKELFLTFDDGPVPEVTPWVLDELARYGAKATFFCIGQNCAAHPELLERIQREGHSVGDHTWDHPRGRRTPFRSYLRNTVRGEHATGSRLFRPPYGSLTWQQYRALRKRYQVILWDVLSADYDQRISGPQCWDRVKRGTKRGSIIVFHDSLKAEKNLRYTLPRALEYFAAQGFRFRALATDPRA
ncbi:MAG TPA: polysaccharide deacetylase family protein [Flavobacteriales bacterium]|jgi:peptidoglycan/xylan/chitin deacetylase (PgdA/CDA1 family)|nr:polysaccharide deacetylase family protein [Flavobacteriales bacterium]HQX98778.1 polysaccharide deacetylase family protein [Flavobacteriales bacterium]